MNQALINAQKEIKINNPEPFYWAGFMLIE